MTLAGIEEELTAMLDGRTEIPADRVRALWVLIEAKKVHELNGIRGAPWHLANVKSEEGLREP